MNPLIRLIPPFFVRFFARPYVAGDSLDLAMGAVNDLWQKRSLMATLDLLAEDIRQQSQADENLRTYLRMVDAVAAWNGAGPEGRPTLSLKPSSYTTTPLHEGWQKGHRHVGCVMQTRLHRTDKDLDALPSGMRVRLVIGIYREPSDIALVDKPAMKQRMLDYAERLLKRGHYVEFATHDESIVRKFVDEVVPRRRGIAAVERAELRGVEQRRRQQAAGAGVVLGAGALAGGEGEAEQERKQATHWRQGHQEMRSIRSHRAR